MHKLSPLAFYRESRSYCQGMKPWQFWSYLPLAYLRFLYFAGALTYPTKRRG